MAANDSHSTGMRGGWKDTMWSTYAIYVGGIGRVLTYKWGTKAVGRPKINQRAQRALLCTIAENAGGDPRGVG